MGYFQNHGPLLLHKHITALDIYGYQNGTLILGTTASTQARSSAASSDSCRRRACPEARYAKTSPNTQPPGHLDGLKNFKAERVVQDSLGISLERQFLKS